jgi:hypothetical protein
MAISRPGWGREFSLADPPLALLAAFVAGYAAALMFHRR